MNDDSEYGIEKLTEWVREDSDTMRLLRAVRAKAPEGGYLAAGALRNLVWDLKHGYDTRTPLHDVDVVYYDENDLSPVSEQEAETRLRMCAPEMNWQVRNQARMHVRNGEPPYLSVARAMQGWPETATAIGARLTEDDRMEWICPWGIDDLLGLMLRPSPLCKDRQAFRERVQAKGWKRQWPKLVLCES